MPARTRLSLPKLVLTAPLALALAGGVGGCVNQDAYDRLVASNDALKTQNQNLLDQNAALDAANKELAARFASGDITREQQAQMIKDLQAELEKRNQMLAGYDSRFNNLNVGTLLDPQTDAALKDLAARYPNLLSYDAERGLVRFNSDITFASGDFNVTPTAQSAIAEFAKLLLQIPSASQYDLKIIGHTDAQRVTQKGGRRFINNDELSAFRAISVANAFNANGIAKQKTEFAGFGESRPAVTNNANGNTPQNRRVEVYLVKSTWNGQIAPAAPSSSAPAPAPRPATKPMDVMK